MSTSVLGLGMPGPIEWAIIGGVALLIFGRRLPEMARSIGKSIVEFKRGMRDVKDDLDVQSRIESSSPEKLPHSDAGSDDSDAAASEPSEKSSAAK